MKIHLHKSLYRALLLVVFSSVAVPQILAQSTTTLEDWELDSQFNGVEQIHFTTWANDRESITGAITLPSGAQYILPDGSTASSDLEYTSVNKYGQFLNAEGETIIDINTGEPLVVRDLIVFDIDIAEAETWQGPQFTPAGTYFIPTTYLPLVGSSGATGPAADFSFGLSDYSIFRKDELNTIVNIGSVGALFDFESANVNVLAAGKSQNMGNASQKASTIVLADTEGRDWLSAYVTGGNNLDSSGPTEANFTGDTTLILKGNEAITGVIGGNYANGLAGSTSNFIGSTKISAQMSDAAVYSIHGGNFNNGQGIANFGSSSSNSTVDIIVHDNTSFSSIYGANYGKSDTFIGNTNITIYSKNLEVEGIIVGANYLTNESSTSFTGNTNIKITGLNYENNYIHGIRFTDKQSVVGGMSQEYNIVYGDSGALGYEHFKSYPLHNYEGQTATLNGNTYITLDFSEHTKPEGDNFFNLSVTGGSQAFAGIQLTHDGDANITITGAEGVKFNRWFIGGNSVSDVQEYEYMTYEGDSFPSIARNQLASAYIKHVNVSVDSGDFTANMSESTSDPYQWSDLFVIGSWTAGGGNIETGSTQGTITGGQFTKLVGGNVSSANFLDFDGLSSTDTSAGASVMGNVKLDVSGTTTSTEMIVGGNFISEEVTAIQGVKSEVIKLAAQVADTDINITGGSHSQVTAGSYINNNLAKSSVNDAGYEVQQGNLSVSITGNSTISNGKISGAGFMEDSKTISAQVRDYYQSITDDVIISRFDTVNTDRYGDFPTGTTTPEQIAIISILTESTQVELGSNVTFIGDTLVSGDLLTQDATVLSNSYNEMKSMLESSLRWADEAETAIINQLISNLDADWQIAQTFDPAAPITTPNSLVQGNRELRLNDGRYENLTSVSFIEFDEVSVGSNSVVDFAQNSQNLDAFNGRNVLGVDGIHAAADDFTGENTLRKTGQGTLILDETNGQANKATSDAQSNLQLVVEQGKVVLSANSSATTQTDFMTLAVQANAKLDMSAGNNTAAGAAGINGNLNLEQDAILIADASRYMAGTGTSMTGGTLSVDMDFMLSLKNTDSIHIAESSAVTLPVGASVVADFALGAFEIVLFSDLTLTQGIDFTTATWGGEEVLIAFAADYISLLGDELTGESYYMGDNDGVWENDELYLVLRNSDLILTSGVEQLTIPEPSTATLSLLALAGLLARRRRKTA